MNRDAVGVSLNGWMFRRCRAAADEGRGCRCCPASGAGQGGVEAIAVSFLWSFLNPAHEARVRENHRAGGARNLCHAVLGHCAGAGEYERGSTAVINAYAGRITRNYLTELSALLARAAMPARRW